MSWSNKRLLIKTIKFQIENNTKQTALKHCFLFCLKYNILILYTNSFIVQNVQRIKGRTCRGFNTRTEAGWDTRLEAVCVAFLLLLLCCKSSVKYFYFCIVINVEYYNL